MLEFEGQIRWKRCVFSRFLKMVKDSAAGIELSRSFHQEGTVGNRGNVKVILCSLGRTIKRRSLAERKLLEAHKSEVMNLGKGVQSQRWFCSQTLML